jgi:hypothetical protein
VRVFEQALKLDPADADAIEGRKKCQERLK